MRRERHGRRHISALNHLHGIRTSQPKLWRQRSPADVVAAEIHKWYEVTRILNASPHDWCPPVPNAAWVEQHASVRLPCQRVERHRALLVAHPVPNALRHTLCPTPLGWRPRAASFTMELLLSPEALWGERGQNALVAQNGHALQHALPKLVGYTSYGTTIINSSGAVANPTNSICSS